MRTATREARCSDGVTRPIEARRDIERCVAWLFGSVDRTMWVPYRSDGTLQITSTSSHRAIVERVSEAFLHEEAQLYSPEEVSQLIAAEGLFVDAEPAVDPTDMHRLFGTSDIDLEANRRGRLSGDQRRTLRGSGSGRWLKVWLTIAWLLPLGLFAWSAVAYREQTGPAMIVAGGIWVAVGGGLTAWNGRHRVFGTVLHVDGPVEGVALPFGRSSRYIDVGDLQLDLGADGRVAAFETDRDHRLFYLRGTRRQVVAAEPLPSIATESRTEAVAKRLTRLRVLSLVAVMAFAGLWFTPLLIPAGIALMWGLPWLVWSTRDNAMRRVAGRMDVAVEYSSISASWHPRRGTPFFKAAAFEAQQLVVTMLSIVASLLGLVAVVLVVFYLDGTGNYWQVL